MGYAREDWIVTSPQRVSPFVQNAKCGDSTTSTAFSLLTLLICQCPPRSVIFPPCSRSLTIYIPTGSTLTISCQGKSLNDTRASSIVQNGRYLLICLLLLGFINIFMKYLKIIKLMSIHIYCQQIDLTRLRSLRSLDLSEKAYYLSSVRSQLLKLVVCLLPDTQS